MFDKDDTIKSDFYEFNTIEVDSLCLRFSIFAFSPQVLRDRLDKSRAVL